MLTLEEISYIPLKTITAKSSLRSVIVELSTHAAKEDFNAYWTCLETSVLRHKVKFPILEYVAVQIHQHLEREDENRLLNKLAEVKHESCYPVIGKLIQFRLASETKSAYEMAIEHIIEGDKWYVCDIISERVFGEGTLRDFDGSLPLLKKMGEHGNLWIERSIGIATHYATKKKLPKTQVEQLLLLMIKHGWKTQYFTKKGIGWAGKTIGKFHPDLIHKHTDLLRTTPLSKWFTTKVNIGLSMAKAVPLNL